LSIQFIFCWLIVPFTFLDAELLHTVVEDDEDEDVMADGGEAIEGTDVQAVQRRMHRCIRVLAKFNQRAKKGR
jgi:hypothetical protein